jgi:hypothetical protein
MDSRETLLLAEYKEVFAEVRLAISLQYSALGVGLIVLTFPVKGALEAKTSAPELSTALVLTIPIWVFLSPSAWAGEVARMRRGSVYLSHVEKSLSALSARANTAEETFGFHSWLLSSKGAPQLKMNYLAILSVFVTIGLGAVGYVAFQKWGELSALEPTFAAVALAVVAPLFCLGILVVVVRLATVNRWSVRQNLLSARPSSVDAQDGA